jgi:hypothetical protein
MKSVRFASLSHVEVIETVFSEALDGVNSRWWSRADYLANKKDLMQVATCKPVLNLVEERYSKIVLNAFATIHRGEPLSSAQESDFILEITKENFNRGIEKYILVELHQSYRSRRNRLKSLIFALQDSHKSMGLQKNHIRDLIHIASEKSSEGARKMAYLFGQADEFAAKKDNDVHSFSAEITIANKGSVIFNPAA